MMRMLHGSLRLVFVLEGRSVIIPVTIFPERPVYPTACLDKRADRITELFTSPADVSVARGAGHSIWLRPRGSVG
jgi:hypothetical protein